MTSGTLSLRVQPVNAEVTIDGERWMSSDGEHFIVQLAVGPHRVEVVKSGHQHFATDIQARDGEAIPLTVSLIRHRP